MIKIEVRGMREVQDKLRRMPAEIRGKVLQPAINKVADKARADITRTIPEEFAVKASDVRSSVDIRRARGGNLEAVIEVFGSTRRKGRSLNLVHFLAAINKMKTRGSKAKASEIKKLEEQIGFLIKKAGGLKQIKGAFIGNRGRTVFERVGGTMDSRSKYSGTKHGEKIAPVQVIGYGQMFNSRKINRRVMDKVRTELPIEIDRALAMLKARGIL